MSSSEHGLQQCLNKLNDYTKKWKLQVNLKKTKLIIFNKSGRKLNASCSFGSKTVDMATSYTYLGFVLTPVWFFLSKPRPVVQQRLAYYVYSFKRLSTHWMEPQYVYSLSFLTQWLDLFCYKIVKFGEHISWTFHLCSHLGEKIFNTGLICEKLQKKMYKMILGAC